MTCVEMELGEPDASGRRRPIVKEGSEFELDVDTMIMALGHQPQPADPSIVVPPRPGYRFMHGCIITDGPDGLTSRRSSMPAAMLLPVPLTVILAMGAVRKPPRPLTKPSRQRTGITE